MKKTVRPVLLLLWPVTISVTKLKKNESQGWSTDSISFFILLHWRKCGFMKNRITVETETGQKIRNEEIAWLKKSAQRMWAICCIMCCSKTWKWITFTQHRLWNAHKHRKMWRYGVVTVRWGCSLSDFGVFVFTPTKHTWTDSKQ